MAPHPLVAVVNPFWHALRGPLAPLAVGDDHAVRFRPDINIFGAVPDHPTDVSWKALQQLIGPEGLVVLSGVDLGVPADWRTEVVTPGVQFAAPTGIGRVSSDVVELTTADADEMLALAESTAPGPYLHRTVEQGGFVGFREDGRLVAMGGFRSRLTGAVEISTVCTAPDYRGRGLARRLVLHLVDQIERAGDRAFLHTAADNAPAIALYEQLGFVLTAQPDFVSVRPPLEVVS